MIIIIKRLVFICADLSFEKNPRDLIHFGALEAINSGINLNRDFGFNHTVSGADLWSR